MIEVGSRADTSTLVLEPTDQAPSLARRFLGKRFRDLGIADDYGGRLVVTELVTNSYKHVGTGQIIVRIYEDERDGLVIVEVQDEGSGMPIIKGEDFDAINGRGLLLMSQLVHDWGARPTNEKGKVIWVKFAR